MKENPLGIQYAVELVFALLPNLTLSTSRVVKVVMSVAYERARNWFHSVRFPLCRGPARLTAHIIPPNTEIS